MGPVMVRLGAELRNRWRSWLTMALLLGVVGGAVLAVAAGARRTDTAYPRFLDAVRAYHVGVFKFTELEGFAEIDFAKIADLPQVADSWEVRYFGDDRIGIEASTDPRWITEFSKVKILEGRIADPTASDEVTVSFLSAQEVGYRVGGFLDVDLLDAAGTPPTPVHLRIVGIHAAAGEFPPLLSESLGFKATRAFAERYASLTVPQGLGLRLQRGNDDVPDFIRELQALSGGDVLFPVLQSDHAQNVERSFHLQAVALWLLAGVAAFGLVLVLGQTLRRQTLIEATEYPTLRSLGMTHRQLALVGVGRAAAIACLGAIIAVIVALLSSPLFPTGIARIAEPDTGFAADLTVLSVGPVALVLLVVLITLPAAVASARRTGDAQGLAELQVPSAKPSFADGLSRAGLPTTAVAGVRLALETGRGRTALPMRSTVAGVALGIAALAAALAFDASLRHLLETPEEYGLRWDAVVLAQFGVDAAPLIEPVLA
ncbi:MAG: FtsX-like permease family protein, partial [Actinomycetota bacterium]